MGKLRDLGYKLCLLSNADVMDVSPWEGSPLSAVFDHALFSYYEGILKPDPGLYRRALDKLGTGAAQCYYAGDGGHEELRGARECGMRTILTTEYISRIWPDRIPALRRDADYEVARPEDILAIIEPEKKGYL